MVRGRVNYLPSVIQSIEGGSVESRHEEEGKEDVEGSIAHVVCLLCAIRRCLALCLLALASAVPTLLAVREPYKHDACQARAECRKPLETSRKHQNPTVERVPASLPSSEKQAHFYDTRQRYGARSLTNDIPMAPLSRHPSSSHRRRTIRIPPSDSRERREDSRKGGRERENRKGGSWRGLGAYL